MELPAIVWLVVGAMGTFMVVLGATTWICRR